LRERVFRGEKEREKEHNGTEREGARWGRKKEMSWVRRKKKKFLGLWVQGFGPFC